MLYIDITTLHARNIAGYSVAHHPSTLRKNISVPSTLRLGRAILQTKPPKSRLARLTEQNDTITLTIKVALRKKHTERRATICRNNRQRVAIHLTLDTQCSTPRSDALDKEFIGKIEHGKIQTIVIILRTMNVCIIPL